MAESVTLHDGTPAAPSRAAKPFPAWAQLLLVTVAIVATLGGLGSLPVLFANDLEVPGPGLGGLAVTLYLAFRPVFAILALVMAGKGRPRPAIAAMAAVVALGWLNLLPSFVLHGLDWDGMAALTSASFLIYPLLAGAAAALAWRNRRLVLGAVLVSVPTLVDLLGVVAFAGSVMRHGF